MSSACRPNLRLQPVVLLCALSLSPLLAGCTAGVSTLDNFYDSPNGNGGGGGGNTGLPCDVTQVLATQCQSCHGTSLTGGAPIPLVTRDDLLKMSYKDPTANYAERSIVRMTDANSPMPPGALPPPSDVQVLQDWLNAGAPVGTCMPDPLTAAPICTSGRTFGGGEGDDMEPGNACISCHATRNAPTFAFAGTVYATGHEPNDCYGGTDTSGNPLSGAQVWVTGADGVVFKANVSSASGNFSLETTALKTPYTAKVVWNGKERPMITPQTNGDCNLCHTQTGTMGAPGRITLPF